MSTDVDEACVRRELRAHPERTPCPAHATPGGLLVPDFECMDVAARLRRSRSEAPTRLGRPAPAREGAAALASPPARER